VRASRTGASLSVVDNPHVQPTSVVIIDDHEGFRSSARTLLEADGYRVVGEAGDGMSGLRVAADLEPDVVLLDVELPDIDGFDVAARLATGEGPQVVLISSREFSGTERVLRSGARGFVPKDELSGEALAAVLR
jgi:DNA-binding NarL/FixJ family response regulator